MKPLARVMTAAVLLAIALPGQALAVPVTHRVDVLKGETKTWEGTPGIGLNANYNGAVPPLGPARVCSNDIQTKCEYALVSVTNPVPEDDADGRLTRSLTITINNFRPLDSPFTDFALTLYSTDKDGAVRGDELATSDNTDVPDPDEQVQVSVVTTRTEPTLYFLVEVAYFYVFNCQYTGTVRF